MSNGGQIGQMRKAVPITWESMKALLDENARLRAELDALKPKPVKHVLYISIYPGSPMVCAGNATRKDADLMAGPTRVACVRVELTEGQYDD